MGSQLEKCTVGEGDVHPITELKKLYGVDKTTTDVFVLNKDGQDLSFNGSAITSESEDGCRRAPPESNTPGIIIAIIGAVIIVIVLIFVVLAAKNNKKNIKAQPQSA